MCSNVHSTNKAIIPPPEQTSKNFLSELCKMYKLVMGEILGCLPYVRVIQIYQTSGGSIN